MPELAEVETLRADVEAELAGRCIESVAVTGLRSVRRHPDPHAFVRRVEGRTLTGTARRGKYLVLRLDGPDSVVAHMGMSGQLLLRDRRDPEARHTHVTLRFSGGADLRFVDPRTFGQMFVTSDDLPELAAVGFDPLDSPDLRERLGRLVASRRTRLKPLIMDQHLISGIGNMYADEILHLAGLHPDRPACGLSGPETDRLAVAVRQVLSDAVLHRGSSLADEQYRDIYGRLGRYQHLHRVYGREGQPCAGCGTAVRRVRFGGRSSFFCPHCQA